MSMDPPKVLLERSFLRAVADTTHPRHDDASTAYAEMVDAYEREEVLLLAVGHHLRELDLGPAPTTQQRIAWFLHRPRRGLFAPVDPLYVGSQHHRAAARTAVDDPHVALTLVMLSRHGVRRIATLDDAFGAFDLELAPVG
jgi:predicted nucleic acid-binding protein